MAPTLNEADLAPAFTLTNQDGLSVSLADYAGRRVVVYFYPAALTPGCTTQAVDFSTHRDALLEAGLSVVGISPDSPEKLATFKAKEGVRITLLSDPEKETLEAYGAFGKKLLYGKEVEGVIRSTFLIDVDETGNGTIVKALYNVRAKGHVDKLMRDLGV